MMKHTDLTRVSDLLRDLDIHRNALIDASAPDGCGPYPPGVTADINGVQFFFTDGPVVEHTVAHLKVRIEQLTQQLRDLGVDATVEAA